jgi:hypothetical protein
MVEINISDEPRIWLEKIDIEDSSLNHENKMRV